MAQTFQGKLVQEGLVLDYTPGSAVAAGDVVIQNSLFGVANQAIAASAQGAIQVRGVYNVVKITGAMTAGTALYWDASGNPLNGVAGSGAATETASGNTFIGHNVLLAASGDEFVTVYVIPVTAVTSSGNLGAIVTDPGTGNAISVAGNGSVSLVSVGAAETRTLAIPTFIGQELMFNMTTDGGDIVMTVASAFNETGNNTITFDNTGETLRLIGVDIGGTLAWRVIANDGAGLTTV